MCVIETRWWSRKVVSIKIIGCCFFIFLFYRSVLGFKNFAKLTVKTFTSDRNTMMINKILFSHINQVNDSFDRNLWLFHFILVDQISDSRILKNSEHLPVIEPRPWLKNPFLSIEYFQRKFKQIFQSKLVKKKKKTIGALLGPFVKQRVGEFST